MREEHLLTEATWTTSEELVAQQVARTLRRAVDIVSSMTTQAPMDTRLLTSVFQAILERSEIPAPTPSEIPARYN